VRRDRGPGLIAALAAVLAVLGALGAASTATADRLVLSPKGLPGLRSTHVGLGTARGDLDTGLTRRDKSIVRHALQIQAAAAKGRHVTLRSDGFVFGSSRTASSLLKAFKRAHHAGKVRLGKDGAEFTVRRGRTRTVTLAWREGASVGVLVLTVRAGAGTARTLALRYARVADSDLKIPPPATSLDRVLAQVRANGTVSEQTALQAFALYYGAIPGVHPPSGRPGVALGGDLAEEWITPYLDKLPARQRKLVDQRLGIVEPPRTAAAHAACVVCDYGDPSFKTNAALQAIANRWASEYASHLGALRLTMVVGTADQKPSSLLDYADATPLLDASGDSGKRPDVPAVCRIRLFPRGTAQPLSGQEWILAHEVFHCYQFQLLGDNAWAAQAPAWVMEGTATWAAFIVDPAMFPPAVAKITQYIDTPHTPLFMRTYDAVGFWLHLQDLTAGFWAQLPAILNGGSSTADFNASGADSTTFIDSWGGSVTRAGSGHDIYWNMVSPFALPGFTALKPGGFQTLPGSATVQALPYATSQYQITGGPIVLVTIPHDARLSVEHNYADLTHAWFCTISACVCPPKTTGTIPPTRPLEPDALLALTGDPLTGTAGDVTIHSIGDFCKPKPNPNTGGGSGGGTSAATGGDPHVLSFGRLLFDFQAAGEFTLLKSRTTNDLDLQVRQQPFPHSTTVSVDTAIAMRVGRATVEIDSASKLGVSALVNHHRLRGTSASLAGGGSLKLVHTGLTLPAGDTPAKLCATSGVSGKELKKCEQLIMAFIGGSTIAEITWKDGTTVHVSNSLTSPSGNQWAPSLSIQIKIARARLRHLEGVIGNAGVSSRREYLSRSGTAYSAKELVGGFGTDASQNKQLYQGYGGSWRITQKQSLFTYKRHKSTRSYTILNFPRSTFNVHKVPAAKSQQAAADCKAAGVTTSAVRHDCEYDVLATGNAAFAGGDVPLQMAEKGTIATPPPPLHPIDLGAGTNQTHVAYDPASGDTYVAWLDDSSTSVDLCVVTPASQKCNAGAGPYHLVDPLVDSGGASPSYFYVAPVVQPGGGVVVTAEIDGASSNADPPGYSGIGVVAWSSPAGGSAFAAPGQGLADGGRLLASAVGAGDPPSGGAVALDATDVGVYGNTYPFGSGFTDFNAAAPAPSTTPVVDNTGSYGDQIGVVGGQVAAEPDPLAPGAYVVVVVGADSGAPAACPTGTRDATGYGVGVGTPAALQTRAAWSTGFFSPISCQASEPVLAGGGPRGGAIGLLEGEGPGLTGSGSDGVYFRRFDTATVRFDAPVLVSAETKVSLEGPDQTSLSEDGAGGLYASWTDHRGLLLSYSSTSGTSWNPPAVVAVPGGAANAVVAGTGAGGAEFAYTQGKQQYLVPVSYSALAGGG
jgi:hypothetical protein